MRLVDRRQTRLHHTVSGFGRFRAAEAYLGSTQSAGPEGTGTGGGLDSRYCHASSSPPSETGLARTPSSFVRANASAGDAIGSTAIESQLGWTLDWYPAHQLAALGDIGLGLASTNPLSVADSLSSRLVKLAAVAEEEEINVSEESRRDLLRFLATRRLVREASLYLLPGGNFRAVWWNDRREQLGLQFLGDGEVQYVIFKEREDAPGKFRRSYGQDEIRRIDKLIQAMNVGYLIAG